MAHLVSEASVRKLHFFLTRSFVKLTEGDIERLKQIRAWKKVEASWLYPKDPSVVLSPHCY